MHNSNNWKFVTPSYVASQKIKGFKNANRIKSFAMKNDVVCGWFKNTGSKGKYFLVEFGSFKKAIRSCASTNTWNGWTTKKTTAKKTTTRKPHKASARRTSSYNWKARYTRRAA